MVIIMNITVVVRCLEPREPLVASLRVLLFHKSQIQGLQFKG